METVDLQLSNPYQTQDEGPGSNNDRATDIGSLDPLVQLGLVDPKSGDALPTDDWQPPQAQQNSQGQPTQTSDQPGLPTGQPAPAAQGPTPAQEYAYRINVLQAQAEAAYQQAVSGGADPGVARQLVNAKLEAEAAKVQSQLREAALLPAAKTQVAQLIATRQGMGQVRPEELLSYDTPQAMEAAASQLAQARRAGNYQNRQAAGRDRVEGAQPGRGISAAVDDLSPEKKIELGIRRRQYS